MNKCVLDASALLALLNSEPGAEVVETMLPSSIMSTVNIAEVVAELDKKLNITPNQSKEMVEAIINQIIPLDFSQAIEVGHLRKLTAKFGLSLGDRACIALAIASNAPVYNADKAWTKLKLDCEIILIR